MKFLVQLRSLSLVGVILSLAVADNSANAETVDANTLLYLSFNNSLNGAAGEVPISQSGIGFTAGLNGDAATFQDPSNLTYPAAGNIDPSIGTLEFLLKNNWNGNDFNDYLFLRWGFGGGGMVFAKDGANNLRGIFNQFGIGGQPEFGVPGFNVSAWQAEEWHGLAFTWNDTTKSLKLYVDGVLETSGTYSGTLPLIADSTFQIGANGASQYLDGALDSLRLSNTERSATEIADYYQTASVPEPSTGLLLITGAGLLAFRRRCRQKYAVDPKNWTG
jgi:hypothetical protein